MKTKEAKVQSKKASFVGLCTYKEYDTVQEAIQDMGEQDTLGVINTQVKTNAMNKVRSENAGEPSKDLLRTRAMMALAGDPSRLQAVAGDTAAMEKLLEETMAAEREKIMQERQARAAQATAAGADNGDEDDDDE